MSSQTNETSPLLSTGSIKLFQVSRFDDLQVFNNTQHTLQLLSITKIITNANLPESSCYRVIIYDGERHMMAMLATRLNGMVHDKSIRKNCVVVVDWLTCFNINVSQKILLMLSLRVVAYPEAKIGEPKPVDRNNSPPRMNGPRGNIYPIEALTPYHKQYWKIKARITYKSYMQQRQTETAGTTTGSTGESASSGQFFKLTLTDHTASMQATVIDAREFDSIRPCDPEAFRLLEMLQVYERLKQGKVYYISVGQVHFAKGSSDRIDPPSSSFINAYEILLEMGVFTFEECIEEEESRLIESRESLDVA